MEKFLPLKIKIINLQDESKLIRRKAESILSEIAKFKLKKPALGKEYEEKNIWRYVSLRNHRIYVVRKEQRSAFLAYGFIRGRAYKEVEQSTKSQPDWKRVLEIVNKFWEDGFSTEKVKHRFHAADIENWKKGILKFDWKSNLLVSDEIPNTVSSC